MSQMSPLRCWNKVKEMRTRHLVEVASAREQGKILVTGSNGVPYPLLDGFGDDVVFFGGETYGANVATSPMSLEAMAATEHRGFARDMCAYTRNYWGSMFLDRYALDGRTFPRPDICFTQNTCDAGHAKWFQLVAEHFDVPLITVDIPVSPFDTTLGPKVEYIAAQLHTCIEQLEQITGRRFDDEKAIAASRSFFECQTVWAEIVLLNAAIPAPLEMKTLMGLVPLTLLYGNEADTLALHKEVRDEVEWRIACGIAAVENERIRVLTDMQPPWNFLGLFRGFAERGVVFVGIYYYVINGGIVEFCADGTVRPGKMPDEQGWPMNTRDDLLRAWGRHFMTSQSITDMNPRLRAAHILSLAHHFSVDGIVLSYNRGCPLTSQCQPEVKLLLEKEKFPVGVYESNSSDVRDTDPKQITRRLNAFIDLLEQI